MKILTTLLILLILLMGVWIAFTQFSASGTNRVLNAVRDIRPGFTKQQVVDYFGQELQSFPGDMPTGYIDNLLGPRDGGEYLHLFMGYPPRNIVIYLNDDGIVEFVTWDHT